MSKIQASPDIAQVKPEEVQRFVDLFCNDVTQTVNGNLDFSTNFNCRVVTATFGAANTDTAVSHTLGRAVAGYFPVSKSVAMDVYSGSKASTTSIIYLKSTAAGSATLVVF
jgi:hypothetical protein